MFILIHKNVTKLDNEMEVKKILMHAYDIGILNFVATYAESVNRTLTYSFKRFSPNKCRQFQPVITNIFENGRFKNKELFVKRYSNFHNCEIRVYVRNAPPFIVYEPRTPNSSEYVLKGIEGELIKTIAKALNFRISVRNESELSWGTVFLNGTMTFPYDMLRDGKVDILLGIFFSSTEVLHYFSGSLSYLRAPYVFVAKRTTKQKNFEVTWILDPYKWSTWICLAAYLVIVKLLMKITFTGKFRNSAFSVHKAKHSNWLRLFGIALNVPQNVVNSRNPFCFSIIIWCFGFIVFNSAYQGKLYSSYTNLNPEKELFLKDVLKHNYLILTRGPSEVAKILTFVKLLPNRFVNYNLTDPNAIFDVLLNRTEKFVGTLTTLHRFLYHMQTKRLFDNFRLVQEPLSVQQICAYFHNNSFLVEPFNNVIRMLNDAGLISKWMNDAFYMLKYKNIDILKGRLIRSTTPDPLKLEPLKPLFIAFILLELITVLVFIGEVTIHRWKMQHKKFISVNSRRRAQY
ncbi:uncharacterized protein LOC119662005 isoform X1 [Teleopsis dalmanni]|uniref:uncharacterized protein LOC119662005 isoform X1 n=1 Tax=Teleopsis dalmanni TaxID=139649 RepID=UPI0018CDF0C7|nr:uncharacterized protein LOC119662005 isoform X1 [Teleopsis dalmanni]